MPRGWARLRERLGAPRDGASLAVFRILFGALMCVSALRFMANGWVERLFVERRFFFHYWGFEWVEPLPALGMYALYGTIALLGACVALGLFYRVAIVLFFLLFSYAELIDVSNYLNHYYLVSLLALLLCFVPAHGTWSLDARLRPKVRRASVPAWMLYLLRFQVGIVYSYAALAKLGPDWLLHGQPLNLWLNARVDHVPLLGHWFVLPQVAVAMAWAGFLNDLLAPPLLLWRRTRPYMFAVVLVFHAGTHLLFNIGIFPFLMPMAATLFFDPSWPRRWVARFGRAVPARPAAQGAATPVSRPLLAVLLAYALVQVAVPLRTHLYGGDVLWHEQGMRWSWRVMVRAKYGSVTYRVRLPDTGQQQQVSPRRYLTAEQEREMAGQPDLILQLAQHIGDEFRRQGHPDVQVYADATVSLNGRAPAAMIDPAVDLYRVEDSLARADWILPGPDTPPIRLAPRALAEAR